MESGINQLIEVSRFYGNNKDYIIAGGGNTSFKNEEKLWIKASGSSLATIDEGGFVCLSREGLSVIGEKEYSTDSTTREEEVKQDLHAAIISPKDKRPSVETSLHEIIDYPFIVHTHPTLVNSLMCAKNCKEKTHELFGNDVLFIEYTDPGYILFKKVKEQIESFTAEKGFAPQIIFLENHGIFVAAETTEEIIAIYNEIESKLKDQIKNELPSAQAQSFNTEITDKLDVIFPASEGLVAKTATSPLIMNFAKDKNSFEKIMTAFTPDNIVYSKAHYLFIPKQTQVDNIIGSVAQLVKKFKQEHGYEPKVIVQEGEGVIAVEDSEKSANTVLEVFEDMMKISFYAENFGGPKFMTAEQIAFIDNWEVENYRRKIAKAK